MKLIYFDLIDKGKGSPRLIYIPEIVSKAGWDMVAGKIRRFVSRVRTEKEKLPRSYKEVAKVPPWPDLSSISCSGQIFRCRFCGGGVLY